MKYIKKEDILEGAYIELRGNNDLLIEGCDGLLGYEEDLITLQVGKQVLNIKGKRLTMRYLSEKKIGISGYIKGVEYV
ncbi:MAG TPA: YabP/YqfC family sporulation protein [Bacillota bacterium]|nr:YabP/YqfC family sporulation protein [Bacillota bacterium]HOK69808.1 YabP/YqfC family sporulation protein [Bacillota bacterium]HPP86189.1 YabP/YqfC family sporulation protein [Bacillota bacterium]